jgi:hypothetical protein
MTLISLNPLGRLTQLVAVPPQVDKPADITPLPNWAPLFAAAGLDLSQWKAVPPVWTPPVACDARAAWTGSLVERPDLPMRVEAAMYYGKPVYFQLIGPWTDVKTTMEDYVEAPGRRIFIRVYIFVLICLMGMGASSAAE